MLKKEDRPTLEEIEITPAMIEAGVEELCLYDSREDTPDVAVRMIFEAMVSRRAR